MGAGSGFGLRLIPKASASTLLLITFVSIFSKCLSKGFVCIFGKGFFNRLRVLKIEHNQAQHHVKIPITCKVKLWDANLIHLQARLSFKD